MSNCEKCGKIIEDGAVFCLECTRSFDKRETTKEKVRETEIALDHEIFTYKRKHSSFIVKIALALPIILGGFLIIFGVIYFLPELGYSEEISWILPIMAILVSLVIIFQIYRRTHQYSLLYLALSMFIATFGISVIFTEFANLILSLGIALNALIVIIFISRHSSNKKILIFDLVVLIVVIGVSMAFPLYSGVIIASGLILVGLMLIIGKL